MPSQLSELVSLIANATQLVEDTFAETARPNVPSLDDTTPHPLDSHVLSLEMREAIQTIEGACCPALYLNQHVSVSWWISRSLTTSSTSQRAFMSPSSVLLSGAEPGKLGRIMRLLASKHCFREVDQRCLCQQPSQHDALEYKRFIVPGRSYYGRIEQSTVYAHRNLTGPTLGTFVFTSSRTL
ncbi:hypothetical protein IW261DRAFT_1567045 [Armillaria novae-zelandiae]|uniref:Uncharacterized protein n=1 Tax=Armillaria novae-zelandiae TaxID=153914 RepID=A0AA39P3L1_9AGAR|nr:hypothetical protein IW261DRAFT_1567045 [Armillaria novae-zelandiae]